ncbi:hypothetical protein ACT3UD_17945 [Glutamicibacter sp. 287]|uniref:hypothetical protein n=3 Tax=Glutamicibacter TaxID=1742989 RepID=UPI000BB93A09|nr:hypothetical protein [Glutamicibacter sp. BW80]
MAQVSTFWLDTPSPDVQNAAVIGLREDMSWYVAGFAILGFLVGLIKLVMSQDVKSSLIGLATPIVNLILATTAYAVGIGVLLTASDEFSKWIVQRSTGGEIDLTQMLTASSALLASPGTAFLLFILLLLGAIINLLFMYFRDVMFLILSAFIVALAAASGTEQGRQAWRKANGWLVALLLFKPVAAGIYALGFRMLVTGGQTEGEEASVAAAMQSTLIAVLILLLAALALPALIKFIVPAAGVGAGAFSGGAALGAGVTLAAGAAVLAGTGGAAAAGSGAAAAIPNGSTTAASTAAGKGAETAATSGSTASGGEASAAAGGSSAGGGSGASEAVSGGGSSSGSSSADSGSSSSAPAGGGSDSSGSSSSASSVGATPSGSESSSSSETGSSPSSGSGDSSAPASGDNAQSGANSNESANSSQSSGSSPEGSSDGQGTTPNGGPSGAKPANKVTEAMQKMGDMKDLAQGSNPSKLVDEDGE